MLIVNPKYELLRSWINRIPQEFSSIGEVIYKDRNEIRRVNHDGRTYCIKRYHIPRGFNRIIYRFFRKPKAVRAYEYANRLRQLSIETPEPVGVILCDDGFSYLVTPMSALKRNFYEFRDGKIEGKEDIIRAFVRFTADAHRKDVIHKDYSPGNILFDKVNGEWRFEMVDINRMRFGKVDMRKGCANFCRLWGKRDFFETLSDEYAKVMGYDSQECLSEILKSRKRFWRHRSTDHFVTDGSFSVGVVISTYNNPRWLERAFWGLINQDHPADEIIVADDGSIDDTRQLIERYKPFLPIKHVWHEDKGFRKTTILNRAVEEAKSDYLIFMDQDLIARRDFIRQHYNHANRGCYLSGGYVRLNLETSEKITLDDVQQNFCFSVEWLVSQGMTISWKMSKLCKSGLFCWFLDKITTTKASWNGCNSSTWREYILNAQGFDERMRYGAEDREFGSRLENAGIKGIQMRYRVPLLHLWHERPYVNDEDWKRNKAIWKETRKLRKTKTEYGIWKKK